MNTRTRASFVLVVLLAALAGCGGDGDEATPITGTFVGKVSETDAFVAVVAEPAGEGEDRGAVTVYVSDAQRIDEWLTGSATEDGFAATSKDRDAEAKGKLSSEAVTGTIELPDGERVRYTARAATATAGLYDLTVSSKGELRGASAAGVALKGETTLPSPGPGEIKLADGTRLKFDVARDTGGKPAGLRAGHVRLIVLPGGQLTGAAISRPNAGGRGSDSFVLSSSG
jgi:hypothetical protein